MSELIRLAVVMARCGLGRSQIYEREKAGTFPRRIVLGPQTVAWNAAEIQKWIDARIAERDTAAGPLREAGKKLVEARAAHKAAGTSKRDAKRRAELEGSKETQRAR